MNEVKLINLNINMMKDIIKEYDKRIESYGDVTENHVPNRLIINPINYTYMFVVETKPFKQEDKTNLEISEIFDPPKLDLPF